MPYMAKDSHELLFLVASEFVELSTTQKLKIGFKLGLIDYGGYFVSSNTAEEMIFTNAFKHNKIYRLVAEMQKLKNEPIK